jgi:hypothetical protein
MDMSFRNYHYRALARRLGCEDELDGIDEPDTPPIDVQPSEPPWIELKRKHGIKSTYLPHFDKVGAIYGSHYELGDDERYAVTKLLHALRLDGWERVSIER